jgi:hypothetical protein
MSILIALPCYGGVVSDKTAKGLFNLGKDLRSNQIDHGLITLANESLITKGRSRIANFFTNNTTYEYVMFIDADIGFESVDVLNLISHKRDIVCGAYPMKGIPLKYNYNITQPPIAEDGLIQIDNIGFGFALIHRRVFDKIRENYEELKYIPALGNSSYPISEAEYNNSYHYFNELKKDMSFLPEDFSFFERAKSVGFTAWLDTNISLSHVGSYVFCQDK